MYLQCVGSVFVVGGDGIAVDNCIFFVAGSFFLVDNGFVLLAADVF